jgi:hypothetical protein
MLQGAFPSKANFPVLRGQGKGAVNFTEGDSPSNSPYPVHRAAWLEGRHLREAFLQNLGFTQGAAALEGRHLSGLHIWDFGNGFGASGRLPEHRESNQLWD